MNIEKREFDVDGIHVEHVVPEQGSNETPLLFVHGGCHGSWCWRNFLEYFAGKGRECYALNWYNHYKSTSLPVEQFIKRSIADVTEEVEMVVNHIGDNPIVIGHSMGGMVSQQYAQKFSVPALVLIASVVPTEIGVPEIELPAPIDDENVFEPPPLEFAREMFFQNTDEAVISECYDLLCSESPLAAHEAVEHLLSVDDKKINCPVLVLGAELDRLVLESSARKLAEYYKADYVAFPGQGHNLLTCNGWEEVADTIHNWMGSSV